MRTADDSAGIVLRMVDRGLRSRWPLRLLRPVALVRQRFAKPGSVTVVIVNWNTLDFLTVTLEAVRRHSPPETRIVVVDNDSVDGSREYLQRRKDVSTILLPCNIRHARALDLGFLLRGTEFVVALDADAFPTSPEWLTTVLEPLRKGATVAGARGGRVLDRHLVVHDPRLRDREFVHPCYLAMRVEHFARQRHSFVKHGRMDVGEHLSALEQGHLAFLDPTEIRGPGALGTVFGGVVYHNFYGARHLFETDDPEHDDVDGLSREQVTDAWQEAQTRWSTRREAPTAR
jgi:glycosyltransferase involved in cell wall biosynthesis